MTNSPTSTAPTPYQHGPTNSFESTMPESSSTYQKASFSSTIPPSSPAQRRASFSSTIPDKPELEPLGLGISLLEVPRSKSFTEEVEISISRSSSVYSSYTRSVGFGPEGEDQVEEVQDYTMAPDHAREYQGLPGSTTPPANLEIITGTLPPSTAPPYVPATPRSIPHRNLSPTLSQAPSLAPSQAPSASSRALTPNRLNALNERDPAFLRAIKALCSPELTAAATPLVRSNSMGSIQSQNPNVSRSPPKRSVTSFANRKEEQGHDRGKKRDSGSVRQKFSSFMNLWRGRDEDED